jgi:hypothetical protein
LHITARSFLYSSTAHIIHGKLVPT